MTVVIKWLDNMLWRVNPFSESYINECME
jgi:hypothetical protein